MHRHMDFNWFRFGYHYVSSADIYNRTQYGYSKRPHEVVYTFLWMDIAVK